MKHWLFTDEGKTFLLNTYHSLLCSMADVAKEVGVSTKTVQRALQHHNLPVRSKQEAQEAALQAGRSKNPTEGKPRSDDVKSRISDSVSNHWNERKTT